MAKKRKREVSDEEKLVHESTKTLRRAAKKAKAFEVQKAVRRLKDARGAGRARRWGSASRSCTGP